MDDYTACSEFDNYTGVKFTALGYLYPGISCSCCMQVCVLQQAGHFKFESCSIAASETWHLQSSSEFRPQASRLAASMRRRSPPPGGRVRAEADEVFLGRLVGRRYPGVNTVHAARHVLRSALAGINNLAHQHSATTY
jgi:hypothetical protein